MTDLAQAIADLSGLFDQLGLRYAVMGGIAVRAYAIPRPTYDVDFTVSIERARLPELYQNVARIGYTVPESYRRGWVDEVSGLPLVKFKLYLQERGVDIDIFLAESPYQEQLLTRRRLEEMHGRAVWLVTPEDLILLKLLASRARDMADISDIIFTQGQLDTTYMRKWASQLGLLDKLERALADSEQT